MGRIETEHDNFPLPEPELVEGDTQPYEVAPGYVDQLPPFMAARGYVVSAPPFADHTPMPAAPILVPRVARRTLRQRLAAAFHAFLEQLRREEEWQL